MHAREVWALLHPLMPYGGHQQLPCVLWTWQVFRGNCWLRKLYVLIWLGGKEMQHPLPRRRTEPL